MKQSPSPKRHISKTTLKRWQHDTKSTAKTSARRMLAGMQGWGFGDGRRIFVLCPDRIVVRAKYLVCGQSPLLRSGETTQLATAQLASACPLSPRFKADVLWRPVGVIRVVATRSRCSL